MASGAAGAASVEAATSAGAVVSAALGAGAARTVSPSGPGVKPTTGTWIVVETVDSVLLPGISPPDRTPVVYLAGTVTTVLIAIVDIGVLDAPVEAAAVASPMDAGLVTASAVVTVVPVATREVVVKVVLDLAGQLVTSAEQLVTTISVVL